MNIVCVLAWRSSAHVGGPCLAHLPYGEKGVLAHVIDPEAATGLLASRYAPDRYREAEVG